MFKYIYGLWTTNKVLGPLSLRCWNILFIFSILYCNSWKTILIHHYSSKTLAINLKLRRNNRVEVKNFDQIYFHITYQICHLTLHHSKIKIVQNVIEQSIMFQVQLQIIRSISTSASRYGKRNFRKFQMFNKRGSRLFKEAQRENPQLDLLDSNIFTLRLLKNCIK